MKSDPVFNSNGYITTHYEGEGEIGYPVDYFVPNLGIDADVVNTLKHAGDSEKLLKVKWDVLKKPPPPYPVDYVVHNLGRDEDIADSFKSLKLSEENLRHEWKWKKYHGKDHLNNPVPPAMLP